MKSITFTISHFDKPLSFDLDVFSIVIGIERSKDVVSIPPKKTVKAGPVTLGLTDGNDTSLSSSDLINSSLLHPVTDKKERKSNICYTRYLSLIMEHLMGDAYINENLKTLKPHHITAITFKPTLENETALTSHMCKVAELSPDPIKYLLPPSRELKKKTILPSSKPKYSIQARDVPPKKQVAETQPTEETVATAGTT
ncbi:hypothetical protein Tco_0869004 [Tanacetum coccineum]